MCLKLTRWDNAFLYDNLGTRFLSNLCLSLAAGVYLFIFIEYSTFKKANVLTALKTADKYFVFFKRDKQNNCDSHAASCGVVHDIFSVSQ